MDGIDVTPVALTMVLGAGCAADEWGRKHARIEVGVAAVHAYGADAVGRIVVTPAVADLARASVAPTHQLVVVELGAGVLTTCRE